MRDMIFSGRTILITGASSGVGEYLARYLASQGAQIACCARRADRLDTLVADIKAAGGHAVAIPCDVADAASIPAAFDQAERALGPIDSVICNAGINHAGPAIKLTVEHLDAILSVNLRGAFLTAQEGAKRLSSPHVSEAHRRIIFISSVLSSKILAGAAIYSATKAGVSMMTKTLALEWARRNITVNSLCPGYMKTDIIDDWFESEAGLAMVNAWPKKRFMALEQLNGALSFLLSPAGAGTTGQSIFVDEGQALV